MTKYAQALAVLKRLEGTIVADIRSLLEWARDFDERHTPQTQLGGLNFTLSLVSLLACEVYGFYLTGAKKHQGISSPAQADKGYYTMEFIQRHFPKGSYFKKLAKVLADYVRHDLVHGFGSSNATVPFAIMLSIGSSAPAEILAGMRHGKKTIALNSVALAEQIIKACMSMQKKVKNGKDTSVIDNILKAKRLKLSVVLAVSNQFDQVYEEALRKKLELPRRSASSRIMPRGRAQLR
jgi:hypothetical protein